MRQICFFALFIITSIFLHSPAHAQSEPQTAQRGLPVTPLSIMTADGVLHTFQVEIANTPQSRETGLMFRTELAPDAGMLFINDGPEPMAMWMKNTLIPLDILFIAADGRITNIHAAAGPQTLTPRPSKGPVLGALELASGTCARLHLNAGDWVLHPAFQAR